MKIRLSHRLVPGSIRGVAIETAAVLIMGAVALAIAFVLTRIF